MMRGRGARRTAPALLTLGALLLVLSAGRGLDTAEQGRTGRIAADDGFRSLALALPLPTPAVDCRVDAEALALLSARAAALTGTLALVEPQERPEAARVAAQEMHDLVARALNLQGGRSLSGVLADLAGALEAYAAGDPAALGRVREASARNAALRKRLCEQHIVCGGGDR